jgi:phospholipase/carboxylesterase
MNLVHTVYEPPGPGPHPTLLTLHGWGANAFDLLGLAPYLCGGKFLILCPQGPIQVPLGGSAVGYGWFPLSMGGSLDVQSVARARELVQSFLDDAQQRYAIDNKKLAVVGFSQGGVMAYSLGLGEPDRYAGLAALSSWLPRDLLNILPDVPATEQLPVLVQHGSKDQAIDVGRARQSVETLRDLRVPVTYKEYDMGHELNANSLGDLSSWLEDKVLSPIVLAS